MSSCHHLFISLPPLNIATQLTSGAITGELDFDLEAVLKSAVLAGALSAATNIIDTNVFPDGVNNYGQKISREILHGLAKKAIYGGDIEAIMAESAGNIAFDYIAYDVYSENSKFPAIRDNIPKDVIHGLVGGALSELGGGDFSQGAISTVTAHVVGEYAGEMLMRTKNPPSQEVLLEQVKAISSIVSATVVLATHENVTDEELSIAQSMSSSVVEYNYLQTFEQKLDFLQGLASKLGDLSIEMIEGLMALANMPPQEFDETVKLLLPEGLSQDEADAINGKLKTLVVVFDENTPFEGDAYSAGEDLGDVTSMILVVGGIGKLKKLKKLEESRGSNTPKFKTNKEMDDFAITKGYTEVKGVGSQGQKIYYNKKGNPKYISKSNTDHNGEVVKGYDTLKNAEKGKNYKNYDSEFNEVNQK